MGRSTNGREIRRNLRSNGWEVNITGTPIAGDEFEIEINANGFGDNRNMLLLAGQQSDKIIDNGQSSYIETYSALVGQVGAFSRQAAITQEAQDGLMTQLETQRQSVSGVSLDEEAVKLMQYQQTYQAAAQVITIARSLMDTLFQAVR